MENLLVRWEKKAWRTWRDLMIHYAAGDSPEHFPELFVPDEHVDDRFRTGLHDLPD